MKLDGLQCPACGGIIHITGRQEITECPFCGVSVALNDEKIHIVHDDMEQAGYAFEKGRMRAREEAKRQQAEREVLKTLEEVRNKRAYEREKERRIAEEKERRKLNAWKDKLGDLSSETGEYTFERPIGGSPKSFFITLVLVVLFLSMVIVTGQKDAEAIRRSQEEARARQEELHRLNEERERREEIRKERIRLFAEYYAAPAGEQQAGPFADSFWVEESAPVQKMATVVRKRREEWEASERERFEANNVFYFLRKYNRIAEYPVKLPQYNARLEEISVEKSKNRNYEYGVAGKNGSLHVWVYWTSYKPNQDFRAITPVLRDFILTADSSLTDQEAVTAVEKLLSREIDYYSRKKAGAYCLFSNDQTSKTIKFNLMVSGLPKLPRERSWFKEHAKNVPDSNTIGSLMAEAIPQSNANKTIDQTNRKPVSVAPAVSPSGWGPDIYGLDPNEDFDTFMDIFGEEFENEDDAFDAWLEGYANE